LYLSKRKMFLSSTTMNPQPKHIQKREIVDIQKIKYKYILNKNLEIFNFITKCPCRKIALLVEQS